MALPDKFTRNRDAVLPDLDRILREQSTTGWYGEGRIEYTIRDGIVVEVRAAPVRNRRIDAGEK